LREAALIHCSEACYLVPQRVDDFLPALLDQTRQYIEQLRTLQAERKDQDSAGIPHEADILDISAKAIEDGNDLCASSAIDQEGSVQVNSDDTESATCDNIHAWIDHVDAGFRTKVLLPEVASLRSSDDGEASSADERQISDRVKTDGVKRHSRKASSLYSDAGDDDLYVEAAQNATKTGRTFFEQGDFLNAFAYFSEALRMANDLSKKQQQCCDIWKLRFMHGVAAFNSRLPVDSESTLQDVLANAPEVALQTRSVRLQIFDTVHLLAQVEVKLSDLEKAFSYGEFALKGRRRVLGKTSDLSYESVSLVVRILELQGHSLRAESYLSMIPQDRKDDILAKFQYLSPLSEVQSIENSIPPPPPAKSSRRSIQTNRTSLSTSVAERIRNRDSIHSVASRSSVHSGVSSNYSEPSSFASTAPASCPSPALSSDVIPSISEQRARAMRRLSACAIDKRASVVRPDLARSRSCFIPQTYRPARPTSHPAAPLSRPHSFHEPYHVRIGSDMSDDLGELHMPAICELPSHFYSSERLAGLVPYPLRTQRPTKFAELSEDEVSPPSYEDSRPSSINESSVNGSNDLLSSPHSRTPSSFSLSGPATPTGDVKTPPIYESLPPPPFIHPAERQNLSSSINSYVSEEVVPLSPQDISQEPVPWKSSEESQLRRRSLLRVFRAAHPFNDNHASSSASFDGVRLSKKDIASVKSDVLSDDAIAFWQEHLDQNVLHGSPKYVLLRPTASKHLLLDSEGADHIVRSAITADTMHLFIPLKTRMNPHWSLLLVSVKDGMACHYDPQVPMNRSASERVTCKLSSILDKQFTYYSVPDVPQQNSPKDSGMLVTFYMQYLIAKLQATHISEKTDASILAKAVDVKVERKNLMKIIEAKKKSVGARFILEE
jgi:sentrin-specific protease 8